MNMQMEMFSRHLDISGLHSIENSRRKIKGTYRLYFKLWNIVTDHLGMRYDGKDI